MAESKAKSSQEEVQCSLVQCSQRSIYAGYGKVDVRAFKVSQNEKKGMNIDWSLSGLAHFHRKCWEHIEWSAKPGNDKNKLIFSTLESKMIKEAKKTAEIHDSEDEVSREAKRVAEMIKSANYCIVFTGAGISTAAGIGDFRGIHGKWTDRDKEKQHGEKGKKITEKGKRRNMQILRPTYTHEAIQKLTEKNYVKYVISQNVDGLHLLSGVSPDKISELHGNSFVEKCEKCQRRYSRPYRVGGKASNVPTNPCKHCRINHRTGRKCENKKCDGYLMNTIINFGDNLEDYVYHSAIDHAELSDIVISLGSTLQVSPANDLVTMGKKPTRLVICNRQVTPYDNICYDTYANESQVGSRVFGDCDKFMQKLMKNLLSHEELCEWEKGRSDRMLTFDMQRKVTVADKQT